MSDESSSNKTTYCQDDIDDLAYSYVLSHGYQGALAMLDELLANRARDDVGPEDVVAVLCRRILDAIDDEAATISRLLDRMILISRNGARHDVMVVALTGPNPIDRHMGLLLRQRRTELGMSLAILAVDLELTSDALAAIEEGAERLDGAALKRAAALLDVPGHSFLQARPTGENSTGKWQALTDQSSSAD